MRKYRLRKKLYIGEGLLEENIDKLLWKLRFRPQKANLYVILISENPSDQLDIVHSRYLNTKLYDKRTLPLVGIAATYEEAVELICKITDECMAHTGSAYLKQFLEGETS